MLSKRDRRTIESCATGFPVPYGILWGYLELCLDRKLSNEDKREIAVDYLGWKEEHARQMFRE